MYPSIAKPFLSKRRSGAGISALGEHGNAWNGSLLPAHGFSKSFDTSYLSLISVFGQIEADTTLKLFVSQDDIHFYEAATLSDKLSPETPPAEATVWISGTSYSIGDVVIFNNKLRTCVQAHTSSPARTPDNDTYWRDFDPETDTSTYPKQFCSTQVLAARYVRLYTSDEVKLTVTVTAKR